MTTITADRVASEGRGAKLLFVAVFCYYWVTLTPFTDLSVDPSTVEPPWWGFAITVAVFAALLLYALREEIRTAIAQPRALLIAVYGWLFITAAISDDPLTAIKRVCIAITVAISASAVLLLPKSEREFAGLLRNVVLIVLGLCYFGVIFLPRLAIHQPTDFLEPFHAGLWRGLYIQKNEAGAVMVLISFIAIYLMTSWSRPGGAAILALALFFLVKTDSKTAMAMLPGMLVASLVFERVPLLRLPIVIAGVGGLNLLTLGVVAFKPLNDFVASLGIDPTYTARSDIWKLAFGAISHRPLTGYGFQSFWQTPALKNSDLGVFTWAVDAVDAHNGYLEAVMNAGFPGLVLIVVWILLTPLLDVAEIDRKHNFTPLTRLFLRLWLYGIFTACLESTFMDNSGAGWFTLLVAIFGLRFQAKYPHKLAAAEAEYDP
jgi:O-antigen ligase